MQIHWQICTRRGDYVWLLSTKAYNPRQDLIMMPASFNSKFVSWSWVVVMLVEVGEPQ